MTPDAVVVVRSHPVRGIILGLLRERSELSPQDAAALPEILALMGDHISDQPTAVRYHFRRLREAGLISVARKERRRGARKHFFALTEKGRHLPVDGLTLDRIAGVLRSDVHLGAALEAISRLVEASGRAVV